MNKAPWGPQDRSVLRPIEGGVTAVDGIRAHGLAAGIKPSGKPDLSLVVADAPGTTVAVVATTNTFRAPVVEVAVANARDGAARAVITNAGNANAGTGAQGLADAQQTTREVASLLGLQAEQIIPMSTGVIGVPLPMATLLSGLEPLVAGLHAAGGDAAATAICTTDTYTKQVAFEVTDDHGSCRIGVMAKGVGMIEPAMATMLCVATTDAPLAGALLRQMVRRAVDRTFNRISVDACGSTNDTVVALATGTAVTPPSPASIEIAFEAAFADLCQMIVKDGEGATKIARLHVTGARTEADAVLLGRAVAASTLFRSALWGSDPNWGRVLSAMGTTAVDFEPGRVHVSFGGITVCRFGTAATFDRGQVATAMAADDVDVLIDLGQGAEQATFLTCDLTPEYVSFNGMYTT
ncbi:MAG: glutamate N-acetyltransferase/amino-acid N-acetyltransferase [Glaciecola sp.]|jgi:glutamate N-acetyltransferase/amino-acid N-acetyltransferase